VPFVDNFQARGRKQAEEHLPNLLTDMQESWINKAKLTPIQKYPALYKVANTDFP
jgi:hypothetical protein